MSQKQAIFTLLGGRVRFHRANYNPTSDAVWLAAFASNAKTVLDAGIGTGGASLCLLQHYPHAEITGIDISEEMLAECAKNAALNNYNLELIKADITAWKTGRTFDLVMTNPPYFKGTPRKSNGESCIGIHHNADLTKWMTQCLKRVKPRGRFCTIIDAAAVPEVITALVPTAGDIAIFPLFGAKTTAERVLVGAKLGVRTGGRLFSGMSMNSELVLHDGLTIDTVFTRVGPTI